MVVRSALIGLIAFACLVGQARAQIHDYDAAGRLLEVVYEDGTTIRYTYDASGNRLERVVGADADGDGALVVDGSDVCTGPAPMDCEDNCPAAANADQSDVGGVGTAPPDGNGDACQCGDVTADGRADGSDADQMRQARAGLVALAAPAKCNVHGPAGANDCDLADWVVLVRALNALSPGVQQVCGPATEPAQN